MLTVYGDESSDQKQERVFAVVAVIGTQEKWDACEVFWKNRSGNVPYHATDCLAGQGNYKGWTKEKSQSLHDALAELVVKCGLVGCGFAIDLRSFKEIYPGIKRDEPFLYCFGHMVAAATALTKTYNMLKDGEHKERVKFVFHSSNLKYNTARLFEVMSKAKHWEEFTSHLEPSIEFAFSEEYVGPQAADLLAFEIRNEFDKTLRSVTTPSYASGILSQKSGFSRKYYFRADIIDQKKRTDAMDGSSEYWPAYEEWRKKHKRNDNVESRIEFMAYWETQRKAGSEDLRA
jgi:hypothetical protein